MKILSCERMFNKMEEQIADFAEFDPALEQQMAKILEQAVRAAHAMMRCACGVGRTHGRGRRQAWQRPCARVRPLSRRGVVEGEGRGVRTEHGVHTGGRGRDGDAPPRRA